MEKIREIVKKIKIDGKDGDLKYYEDIFDVNSFINQQKFLILGYKGTGKTYFLKKVREIKKENNFKIINCNIEKFYLKFFQKLYDLGIINIVQKQNGHKENILNYNIDGIYQLDEKCFIAINYGLRNHLKLYNLNNN